MEFPIPKVVQDLGNVSVNTSEMFENILPPSLLQGFDMLMTLAKVATVVFIIYLLFLIIGSIVKMRQAKHTRIIAENVEQINKKLDMLLEKKKSSKEKDKDE